jgi:hypothetical protein
MAKKQIKKSKPSKKKAVVANHDKLYFGKAGHLYVMAELLLQKWNVAMPEVDIGDDIFVVRDKDGFFMKVQVKSANAIAKNGKVSATVSTPFKQLTGSGDG